MSVAKSLVSASILTLSSAALAGEFSLSGKSLQPGGMLPAVGKASLVVHYGR